MRILVIEDEPRILEFLRAGSRRGVRPVDGAGDGPRRASRRRACTPSLRARRPRPAPAGPRRPRRPAASCARAPRAAGPDPLGPLRPADEAARLRARRERLPVEAVLVRRAGRARARALRRGRQPVDVRRRCGSGRSSSTSPAASARVGGSAIDLSDREFRLLYHLASHAGEVVSRERLLSEVWGYSFDPGSNVVDVCVRRLRKKLGPDAGRSRRSGMPGTGSRSA